MMGEKTSDYENRVLFEDGLLQRKTKEMMSYLKKEGVNIKYFSLGRWKNLAACLYADVKIQ